jgi:hypothetical protein
MFEGALNNNRNIVALEAKTPDELCDLIARLVLPTNIISIVYDSGRKVHVAYLITSRKIKKTKLNLKE